MCWFFSAWSGYAQISPGPLSRAHRFLEGAGHCVDCHDLAKRPPEYKCLDCHKEVRVRLDSVRGLHPSLVGGDRSGRSCVSCHSEHNGADFPIIHWDAPPARFDHRRAGYALEGKHARLACNACHQPAHISQADAQQLAVKDLSRTYMGLPAKCGGCHEDQHRGQFTMDCGSCHNSNRWQEAPKFDHERARFQLTGAHQKVGCEKCHLKVDDPRPYVRYRNIAFQTCTACHKDPHSGAFPQACSACHGIVNWKPFNVTLVFNHSTTKYALEGKHTGVACNACHATGNFKTPVAFGHCNDCHRKDYHQGQFAQRADGGDCRSCHKVEGFKPSTFTVGLHASTRFPLQEKHASVACAKCHVPLGRETVYLYKSDDCVVCHQDAHKGQFAAAPYGNACEKCHSAATFRPSTFTLARHMKIRFPLEGAHAAIPCAQCHKSPSGIYPPAPVRYSFDREDCQSCHSDPHKGEFAARMAAVRTDGSPLGCRACHTLRDWKEINGFDHSTTSFALEGSHRSVACDACHKAPDLKSGLVTVSFRSAPAVCSGCHDDIHESQFSAGAGAADCSVCHRVFKWKPSTFNHETGSTFHLAGAHRNVPCALCHLSTAEKSGKRVVLYKPTPHECIACHGSVMNRG